MEELENNKIEKKYLTATKKYEKLLATLRHNENSMTKADIEALKEKIAVAEKEYESAADAYLKNFENKN